MTIKELKDILNRYENNDFVVVETHDEQTNDSLDLYDFYVDEIPNVGEDGESEVRICQIPHDYNEIGELIRLNVYDIYLEQRLWRDATQTVKASTHEEAIKIARDTADSKLFDIVKELEFLRDEVELMVVEKGDSGDVVFNRLNQLVTLFKQFNSDPNGEFQHFEGYDRMNGKYLKQEEYKNNG